jgi:hypothetical protein
MRMLLRGARAFCSLLVIACPAFAGSVQLLDGTVHQGEVSIDGGLLVRGTATVKVALNNVLIARLTDEAAPPTYPVGLVLTNGTAIGGTFTSLAETTVVLEGKGLRIPGSEVAWAVYNPFDSALAADLLAGKTGALLPGGDFFEGTIKYADAKSAKVLNPIFGPRVFTGAAKDLHAVILREMKPQPAAFEVITRDGSRYLAMDALARENGVLTLRDPHYDGLRIPAADLLEIRAAPSRMIAIAALKPTRIQGTYATSGADGSKLKMGSQQLQACSLDAGASATWKRTIRGGVFVARVAVATEPTVAEKLVFIVEADGRGLFRSAAIAGADGPHVIRCAMPAAESITLRVEGGSGGRGIWGDPVILLR